MFLQTPLPLPRMTPQFCKIVPVAGLRLLKSSALLGLIGLTLCPSRKCMGSSDVAAVPVAMWRQHREPDNREVKERRSNMVLVTKKLWRNCGKIVENLLRNCEESEKKLYRNSEEILRKLLGCGSKRVRKRITSGPSGWVLRASDLTKDMIKVSAVHAALG